MHLVIRLSAIHSCASMLCIPLLYVLGSFHCFASSYHPNVSGGPMRCDYELEHAAATIVCGGDTFTQPPLPDALPDHPVEPANMQL